MLERLSPAYPKTSARRKRSQGARLWLLVPLVLALFVLRDGVGILLYPQEARLTCRADTVLVMGAAQYNGVPSPAFQRRLDKALELYRQGCAERVVVTGGKRAGDAYTEGASGVRYLETKGVPATALSSETSSTTSYRNLANAAPLLKSRALTIVTDDLHAYRTRWLAEHLGYTPELAPVETSAKRGAYWLRELVILSAYHLGIIR